MRVKLKVNGLVYEANVEPYTSLNDVLREQLGLTGTKRGCDTGGCGICTVIMDGKAVFSCMVPAWRAENKEITTIEGLERDGKLHPIQEAFIRHMAPQCGYCTPGLTMVVKALLDSNPNPTEEELREAMSGVICRCTGYLPYIEAVKEVMATQKRG